MSKTPRTDVNEVEITGYAMSPRHYVRSEIARQLETELADARAEIERLALEIENKQYTITCASEENQQLKESLADARAEIERLSSRDGNASHELVYDDGDNPFAREKLEHVDFGVCDNQYVLESHLLNNALDALKEVRAEIERKDQLIEQMREAIRLLADEYSLHVSRYENRNAHDDQCYIVAEQALAAERSE